MCSTGFFALSLFHIKP
ncbi:hypothetical protein D049_4128A, partial [Vibrio parahaemolyticus VPTS-2010]